VQHYMLLLEDYFFVLNSKALRNWKISLKALEKLLRLNPRTSVIAKTNTIPNIGAIKPKLMRT